MLINHHSIEIFLTEISLNYSFDRNKILNILRNMYEGNCTNYMNRSLNMKITLHSNKIL